MALWRTSGNEREKQRVSFFRTLPGMVCLLAFVVLVAGDVFWLLTDGTWKFAKSPKQPQTSGDSIRIAREKRAKVLNYVKPTATAEMGDLGGKYFGQTPDPAKTRHYYIAAEPVQWDFMPGNKDEVCGMPLPAPVVAKHLVWKVRYFQYTDASFTKRVPQTERLGILGPVLRGLVGEYIEV